MLFTNSFTSDNNLEQRTFSCLKPTDQTATGPNKKLLSQQKETHQRFDLVVGSLRLSVCVCV